MKNNYFSARNIGLFIGLLLFVILLVFQVAPQNQTASYMAAVAALMAVWWMTEAIPLAATALIPLIAYPVLGIMSSKAAAPNYMNNTIFLFIGGFMIAVCMERWNLHKRISLFIIKAIGGGANRVVLGFMIATAFLSMFISNTATAIMMLPIGLSVISHLGEGYDEKVTYSFSHSLMLAIAYSASIGGLATLIGTPPNLVFRHVFHDTFTGAPEISFAGWLFFALPLSAVLLVVAWLLLTRIMFRRAHEIKPDRSVIRDEYKALGQMSYEEKCILTVFIVTGLLWIFRSDIDIGFIIIPGWTNLIKSFIDVKLIDDSTIAVGMAALLFLLPSKSGSGKMLDAKAFRDIPWDIIVLFGGGFALAKGFQESGLSMIIGESLKGLQGFPDILMIALVCLMLTFLTELTSNTATTQTILPILASISIGLGINPLLLMVPATISASCAFMLPVATPPNAIIFGSGKVKIGEMVKTGIVLNLIGVIVISLIFYFWGGPMFDIYFDAAPDWLGK